MSIGDAIRIKEARKRILRNLEICYLSGFTTKSLYTTVCAIDEGYDWKLFQMDLKYLSDKDYIVFVDDKLGGMSSFDKKVVKLTALGKEIAEGTSKDKALEL